MTPIQQSDLNSQDGKELLKEIARSIQTIDESIFDMQERRKELFAKAKEDGFNDKVLRKAIALIRKPLDETEQAEEEIYKDLLDSVISPLK